LKKQTFENKVKSDFESVVNDSSTSLKKLGQSGEEMKKQVFTWVKDETAHLSQKVGSARGSASSKLAAAARSIEQDVDLGMNQYNRKVQHFADRLPGGFSRKTARYPWVTISFSLVIGLLIGLGMLLIPARRPSGSVRI
jgi:hypothetical protein